MTYGGFGTALFFETPQHGPSVPFGKRPPRITSGAESIAARNTFRISLVFCKHTSHHRRIFSIQKSHSK
jgi:hypothetical protein